MERNTPFFATPEQFVETQRANIGAAVSLSQTLFSAMEKLVDLNLKVIRATLDDVATRTHQALDLKDVREVASFNSNHMQPATEKAMAYTRHVYDIVSNAGSEIAKLSESHINERQNKMADALEQLSRNAPAGSETAVAMLKSSFAAGTSAYDTFSKAANQFSEMARSNLNAAADATFKASSNASDAARGNASTSNNAGNQNGNNNSGASRNQNNQSNSGKRVAA